MRRSLAKSIPFFPIIPIVPIALVVGSLATAIQALVRVRRIEQRLGAAQSTP